MWTCQNLQRHMDKGSEQIYEPLEHTQAIIRTYSMIIGT